MSGYPGVTRHSVNVTTLTPSVVSSVEIGRSWNRTDGHEFRTFGSYRWLRVRVSIGARRSSAFTLVSHTDGAARDAGLSRQIRQEGSLAPSQWRVGSLGRSARPAASFQHDRHRWGGRPSHDGTVRIADLGAVL